MVDITLLDYELYILYTMRDAPLEHVDDALRRAGVDSARLAHSYCLVDQENFAVRPTAFEEKTRILGPPVAEGVREIHGRTCPVRSFRLPLWQEFLLDIYGNPDGRVWDERFSRAPEHTAPDVSEPADLRPWSVIKEEVEARFGRLEEEELWPPYESSTLRHVNPEGDTDEYDVVFSWRLLQSIQLATKSNGGRV
ncbi:hypothetical protein [Actinomadura rubrisoli]|uniref:Uncharacterized protein n=1 Tax=Actinomadura rubrisoli TaxID=2530368 RepID=A0A4R5A1I4_9ACTN|nr:hypothetical protein [Actinomadura rubrisoli]TDD65601.1 hypothetical protein E1298_41215 [Actinomadura rubrisoli]